MSKSKSLTQVRRESVVTGENFHYQQKLKRAAGPAEPMPAPRAAVTSVRDRILDKPFASFGEQLRTPSAARPIARERREIDPRLMEINTRALGASGASEQVPADGGYLVQPDFANQIATRMFSTGLLLSQYDYMAMTTNSLKIAGFDEQSRADGSRWGGAQGYWQNEGATVTATKSKYRNIQLTLRKLFALSYLSDELLADAALAASGSAIQIAFANELAFKVEQASIFGDGSDKPLGMLAQGNNALIVVPKDVNQATATITPSNILNMYTRTCGARAGRACWIISESVDSALISAAVAIKNVAGTENVGGIPLYIPAQSDDDFPRILGRPVLVTEYMNQLGTQGDIGFVDCGGVLAPPDKGGVDFSISIHVLFLSDQGVFKAVYRVDAQPKWHAPLTPYNNGSQLSPFVALAARP